MNNNNDFQILSLDGGGIKGLFSAAVLAHLENDLEINIIDHFDLITGTSTGGIIAIALSIGISPKEIVNFYVSKGPKIFDQGNIPKIRRLFYRKYNPKHLSQALKECLGDTKKLKDCKKRLVVPCFNISEGKVCVFKTAHHERLKRDYKYELWKVAMATSAAPTYFPAFDFIDRMRLVDGGVWCNNPIVIGIAEAKSMLNISLEKIKVLSIGTTHEIKKRSKKLINGGVVQWARSISDVLLEAQSISAVGIAEHLIGKDNILRINPNVPQGLFKMDQINDTDLSSYAASVSRDFSPQVYSKFCSHFAEEFMSLK